MNFDLGLAGRRAPVTGGTKGIGAAVVDVLRDAGARVLATARSAPARIAAGAGFVAADLSTADGVRAVARSALERFGGIDILVNVFGASSAPGERQRRATIGASRGRLRRCGQLAAHPLTVVVFVVSHRPVPLEC